MSNDLPLPAALAPITNAPALMHALGSPLRWDVMRKLALDGPQSVTSLGGLMDRAQDSMSRHLTVLWQTGAVVGIEPPDGDTRKQFYAIPPARLRTVPGGKEIDYGVCVLRFP
jgi:DNA-binding transcriptional ArsR family regulator